MTLKIKIITTSIVLWMLFIVSYLIISVKDFKLIPIAVTVFMASGVLYSLLKYLNQGKKMQNNINIKQFEIEYKIAKPLRLIGIIFLILQFSMMIELFHLSFDPYFALLSVVSFSGYFILLILYSRKRG